MHPDDYFYVIFFFSFLICSWSKCIVTLPSNSFSYLCSSMKKMAPAHCCQQCLLCPPCAFKGLVCATVYLAQSMHSVSALGEAFLGRSYFSEHITMPAILASSFGSCFLVQACVHIGSTGDLI